MEKSQENHAEYLLRQQIEACEDHRSFVDYVSRFVDAFIERFRNGKQCEISNKREIM
jgi:hypothetical protein